MVGKLINARVNFGLGHRRRVNVNGIDEIWAADLIGMQSFSKDNNGIKYLLTVIEIFSKFVWIIFLKRKT